MNKGEEIMSDIEEEIPTVKVTLPAEDGSISEYEIESPTPEQLILLATSDNPGIAIMGFLGELFGADAYADIRRRLGYGRRNPARLRLEDLIAVTEQIMEARTEFPTEPPTASSSTGGPTGRRSTGRVHSPASTRSDSVPVAS